MADPRVTQLGRHIAQHLTKIEALFTEPVEITLIIRAPAFPDGRRDTVVSTDPEPEKAIEAFRRQLLPGVEHVQLFDPKGGPLNG